MSRLYRYSVDLENVPKELKDKADEAVFEFLGNDSDSYSNNVKSKNKEFLNMYISNELFLCGGMDEETYAHKINNAVWEKLDMFIPVTITATYLEDLPYETFFLTEEDYKDWKGDK